MNHFQRLYDTTVRTLDGLSGNGYGLLETDKVRVDDLEFSYLGYVSLGYFL